MFDYSKTYYKFIKNDKIHNGFKYKLGLNIDTVPFNPNGSCQPGGLYFTDLEHIFEFIDCGELVAEIKIPEDAKVYKDPDNYKTKWKADKIDIISIESIKNKIASLLDKACLKRFDRSKTYYKFLNRYKKYKLGLNIDTIESYQSGFYFTVLEPIFRFIDYGELFAEIKIPEDAKVFKYSNGTWKADKINIISMEPFENKIVSLIEKGANIHAGNDLVLRWATGTGNMEIAKLLLEKGADIRNCNIKLASAHGHIEMVNFLLEKGADIHIDNDDALTSASYNGNTRMVKFLLEKGADIHAENDQALRWASYNEYIDTVELLLEKGANVHADNNRALINASCEGHTEMVKILLEYGADVHAENNEALDCAIENVHVEIVKLLLEYGADVSFNDNYGLKYSSYHGLTEIVKLLLEKGADIHAENDYALRYTSNNGHIETVKLLLEKGADIHAENDYAFKKASENGHTEIVKLLTNVDPNLKS